MSTKLFFAPIFLILLTLLFYFAQPLLSSKDLIFAFNTELLIDFVILAALVSMSSLFFAVFITLSQNIRIIIPVILISCVIPFFFLPIPASYFIAGGLFLTMVPILFVLDAKLKTYVTFSVTHLLTPSIKLLSTFLSLLLTLAFYFQITTEIKKNGFQIPDSIIEMSINLSTGGLINPDIKGEKIAQIPTLTPEQIELLRQNPDLLKQFGLDPSMLDLVVEAQQQSQSSSTPASPTNQQPGSITTSPGSTSSGTVKPQSGQLPKINLPLSLPTINSDLTMSKDFTKNLVKAMLNKAVEPYLNYIAPLMALIFFTTLKFFISIIELFLTPLLITLFTLLEKSGFVSYEKEMREVKKLIL